MILEFLLHISTTNLIPNIGKNILSTSKHPQNITEIAVSEVENNFISTIVLFPLSQFKLSNLPSTSFPVCQTSPHYNMILSCSGLPLNFRCAMTRILGQRSLIKAAQSYWWSAGQTYACKQNQICANIIRPTWCPWCIKVILTHICLVDPSISTGRVHFQF